MFEDQYARCELGNIGLKFMFDGWICGRISNRNVFELICRYEVGYIGLKCIFQRCWSQWSSGVNLKL